jgi:hypothetical protein
MIDKQCYIKSLKHDFFDIGKAAAVFVDIIAVSVCLAIAASVYSQYFTAYNLYVGVTSLCIAGWLVTTMSEGPLSADLSLQMGVQ